VRTRDTGLLLSVSQVPKRDTGFCPDLFALKREMDLRGLTSAEKKAFLPFYLWQVAL
jgi:hypothetical protein